MFRRKNQREIISAALFLFLFLINTGGSLAAQTAEEIVSRADEAMKYETAVMECRMVNTDRFGSKTISYYAWAEGNNFLMEFTSAGEYGQKILRTEDRIYHFFPDAEAIFTRSRGDTIVGLISYEDVTDESGMVENYDVSLVGEELLDEVPCFRVRMNVKQRKRVAYPIQEVWIEKETYAIRRIEMFTRTGQPLKTMVMREFREIDEKRIAVDMIITDDVRRGVSSEIFIDNIELNTDIPSNKFTRRELTR